MSSTGSGPIGRSKMSEVECAGSVDTRSTRRPIRLAASAVAASHVVLPTPPFPPKKSTCRSSKDFIAKLQVQSASSNLEPARVASNFDFDFELCTLNFE